MTRLYLYAALLLLTQCSKCKNDPEPKPPQEPTLPAETQTGANTFGCKLNGNVWLPAGGAFSGGSLSARLFEERLTINASRRVVENGVTIQQSMHFELGGMGLLAQPGLYVLDDSTMRYMWYRDLEKACRYESAQVPVGQIYLTRLDLAGRVVSGRFSFTLKRAGCQDVQATDGRFDLKF